MKPSFALIAASAALGAVLAGCGQPGPLYMPKPPAKPAGKAPAQAPAPETPTLVPDMPAATSPSPTPISPQPAPTQH